MAKDRLARFVLLPELDLVKMSNEPGFGCVFEVRKTSSFEVCPRCATRSRATYDRRIVRIRDAPLRGAQSILQIVKRRFFCKPCKKPFTEPVAGISKGHRTTERLKRYIFEACEKYTDLARVERDFPVSRGAIYLYYYEFLARKKKERLYPWPRDIGLDEHSFSRRANNPSSLEWVTVVVDHVGKRLFEVVPGRTIESLHRFLESIPGRENVRNVTIDMSEGYHTFAKLAFENARVIIDKFHVIQMFGKEVNKARLEVTGDKRKHPARKLVLRSYRKLDFHQKVELNHFLRSSEKLHKIYWYKERLLRFYDQGNHTWANKNIRELIACLKNEKDSVLMRLGRTLENWKYEILNYFKTRLTNARAEGFNCKAKLVKRRAFGFKSFKNYRLRLLNACA